VNGFEGVVRKPERGHAGFALRKTCVSADEDVVDGRGTWR